VQAHQQQTAVLAPAEAECDKKVWAKVLGHEKASKQKWCFCSANRSFCHCVHAEGCAYVIAGLAL
jgi:hypothetical protein